MDLMSTRSIWLHPMHGFGDYRRKLWLVTEYWIDFEMAFIIAEPFLDSLNTYATIETLDSRFFHRCS